MLELDKKLRLMLERFNQESQVILYDHNIEKDSDYPYLMLSRTFKIIFRNLYVDVCETALIAYGRLLTSLMALEGSVGMIATTILYFSKRYGRPRVIYLDRDEPSSTSSIIVEWHVEWIDDNMLERVRESNRLKADRTIRFEDVVGEARKFLVECFQSHL